MISLMATEPHRTPSSEAILFFADYANCQKAVEAIRWPDGVVRARAAAPTTSPTSTTRASGSATGSTRKAKFSLKVGTIFEDSAVAASRSGCPRSGCSPTARTASAATNWPARSASPRRPRGSCSRASGSRLQGEDGGKLGGDVEVDETYIGGKARNMHDEQARAPGHHSGPFDGGQGRRHGPAGASRRRRQSQVRLAQIRQQQAASPAGRTFDAARRARRDRLHRLRCRPTTGLDSRLRPQRHRPRRGLRGRRGPHQRLENFWSLLKRAIKGTYVSVEPFHLFRYLDEQAFRFNERAATDAVALRARPQGHPRQASHLQCAHRLGVAANVLKKASRKNAEVKDVPADDPVGTMDRFTTGLRRVLTARKPRREPTKLKARGK